ncbi:MAG: hypothetical protein AMS27_05025 [Bacteroides sp. SM23_62_1]|nr:MAG: hypothetical protein AMS27_05025 [Bacteroides sp. SM23_62_1]
MTAGEYSRKKQEDKPIRIGIIGAENSHTIGFGKLFNIEKKFPGVEVLYVWGETEEFARNAMINGGIPNMVSDPGEMTGKIDALIVDHRHPKYHLEAATPFVKAGIPTFIDKPFCYRVSEGKEFLAMARDLGTPITSYSSIAQSDATFDMKEQVEALGEINHVIRCGPADLESQYGGIFFYGVHCVQPLMYMFGEEIERVRITKNGKNAGANLAYKNGMLATIIFKSLHYGWETFVETKEGVIELKSRVDEADPPRNYTDMVEMFRTGKEPRSHQSILNCVAVLEALEKSSTNEKWEEVMV